MRSIITAGATKNSIDDVGSHTVVTISSTPKPPWFLKKHSLVLLLFFSRKPSKTAYLQQKTYLFEIITS